MAAAATPASGGGGGEMLKFCTLESRVDIGFWSELAARKLDRYRLSDAPVGVQGTLVASRYAEVASRLELDAGAFVDDDEQQQQQPPEAPELDEAAVTPPTHPTQTNNPPQQPQRHRARGTLVLSNSLDEFRALDRPALMRRVARDLWGDVLSGSAERDPSRLLPFLLIAHADLKRYVFHYQFAFPALRPPVPLTVLDPGAQTVAEALEGGNEEAAAAVLAACDAWRQRQGGGDHNNAAPPPAPFWLVRLGGNDDAEPTCHPLSAWAELTAHDDDNKVLVAMADPCHLPLVPGWPLRNLLLLASARWVAQDAPPLKLRVLCLRDGSSTGRASAAQGRSFVVDVAVPPLPEGWKGAGRGASAATANNEEQPEEAPDALGWEPDASGRPVPRELDLSSHLSPLALAEQAVALNLRLMRWRAAPELELAPIARCRCLLLGAGTLGCALARTLLAWGVRKITFVDSGRVAYSNPVRQSLFEHSDCLEGGKPKAAAAAEALLRICPGVETSGIDLRIPMPGHADASDADLEADVLKLDALVEDHDAIFLLTDTRESRWLPALLAAARRKVAVTAALGFDNYLVMRHGVPPHDDEDDDEARQSPRPRVGCYFCQDVVAPADSTRRRALDQQCTVARPGLAPIAGALSAELLAALLQHPLGVDAPADLDVGGGGGGQSGGDELLPADATARPPPAPALGHVPHMIRGHLHGFGQVTMAGRAFPQCTACGPAAVKAWRERGAALVLEAAADPSSLERLTGLAALREEAERRLYKGDKAEAIDDDETEGQGGGARREGGEEDDDDDDEDGWVDL